MLIICCTWVGSLTNLPWRGGFRSDELDPCCSFHPPPPLLPHSPTRLSHRTDLAASILSATASPTLSATAHTAAALASVASHTATLSTTASASAILAATFAASANATAAVAAASCASTSNASS